MIFSVVFGGRKVSSRGDRIRYFVATLLLAFGTCLALSCCLLVPFIDAFKQTGATEGDRMALLPPEVKKFTEAVGWGNKTEAMGLVAEEARKEIAKQLKGVGTEERVVESKVEDVEWFDSARSAKVELKVRYFMVPYYVVKTRTEQQKWIFALSSGWKLKERMVVEE